MELWQEFCPEVHSSTSEDKARASGPPSTHCTHFSLPNTKHPTLSTQATTCDLQLHPESTLWWCPYKMDRAGTLVSSL